MVDEGIEVSEEIGELHIADEVVGIIAGMSAVKVDGIYSMSGGFAGSLKNMLGKKDLSRGVKIEIDDDMVDISLYIVVKYGTSIPEVAWQIQDNVKQSVEGMTGLEVINIDVHVQGVEFSAEEQELEEGEE
ncbi:Asp23/Gls24 family envelope stress response protein [Halarsenatibacter silvermanii]|uniref:Uncharacterized conserved protein YloU, alkaline shock protein (Asp23) family n=1 Tax=Halarsenatibacter silvermanii TaxID=321763 RepID=A0A1G9JYY9_9FIRM|nr:Asp23/Gls24 family envelope stress response protein [Halarsenatibacter silvermanii]SDL42446.1 Uncharacterized conserved protein YloU, alkaline shock protein (Asp23) family [Halarsenatibacter silvermanii]